MKILISLYNQPLFTITVILLLTGFLSSPEICAQTIYVKESASGSGTSWTDATGDLVGAMAGATSGTEIWVAQGTYWPDPATDRTKSFQLKEGVSVYGGFPNTGTPIMADRAPQVYLTVLSGDIGSSTVSSDNSFHVLMAINADNCLLDGFYISNGNADGTLTARKSGGGMVITNSSPVIQNCHFENNSATQDGGAVYLNAGSPGSTNSPEFWNCEFNQNTAGNNGGGVALNNWQSTTNPVFINCAFSLNNAVSLKAGAAHFTVNGTGAQADIELHNCWITDNTAATEGGAFFCDANSSGVFNLLIANSLFAENSVPANSGGAMYFNCNNATLSSNLINNTFSGNEAPGGGESLWANSNVSTCNITTSNSLLWNTPTVNTTEIGTSGSANVSMSDSHADGGCPAGVFCTNVNNDNPNFTNPASDDYSLQASSTAINSGKNTHLPLDDHDIDGDNNFSETLPHDINSNARVAEGTVDRGAFENNSTGTGPMNGFYTIDISLPTDYPTGTTFNNFTDAVNALIADGVDGVVTFGVEAGIYDEQILIPEIAGASATNTITFITTTSVPADVILQHSTPVDNWVVKLDGAKHIGFKNITFQTTATTTGKGHVIELYGNDGILFEGNVFNGRTGVSNADDYAVIFSAPADAAGLIQNVHFINNHINDGSTAILINGPGVSDRSRDVIIRGNTINNFIFTAIDLWGTMYIQCESNQIASAQASTYLYGIFSITSYGSSYINNVILLDSPNGSTGIWLWAQYGISAANLCPVTNNMITIADGANNVGISVKDGRDIGVFYNSVNLTTGDVASKALYLEPATSSAFRIYNNVLVNQATGYAIHTTQITDIASCDNNCFYAPAGILAYDGTNNHTTLSDWTAATFFDANSVDGNPNFISDLNLDINTTLPSLLESAAIDKGVATDISLDPRSGYAGYTGTGTAPDIGADEFEGFYMQANAGTNITVCQNPYTLNGNDPEPGTGWWTVISGGGTVETPSLYNSEATLSYGTNSFQWQVDFGVHTSTDAVTITSQMPDKPNAGPDQIVSTTTTTISGTTEAGFTHYWEVVSGGASITSSGSAITTVTNLTPGDNLFRWVRDNAGCVNSDTVNIRLMDSPQGNALHFDGINDYVSVPHNAALDITSELTIECWIKRENTDAKVVGKTNMSNGYLLGIDGSGELYPEIWDNSGTLYSFGAGSVPANTWTHVAITWKTGGDMISYINGSETGRIAASTNPLSASAMDLVIGGAPWDPLSFNFQGTIDELRIWNTQRTPTQIESNAARLLNGTETGLVAYYRFDQGRPTQDNTYLPPELVDYTPNRLTGELVNFAQTGTTSNWANSKDGASGAPKVAASQAGVHDIYTDGATLYADAFYEGTSAISERGFCLSLAPAPMLSDMVVNETGTFTPGGYSLTVSGLLANTTYYYRAYAKNNEGTTYSETYSFDTKITHPTPIAGFGHSLYFDGTDDEMVVPHNAALDPGSGSYTIEMWVKLPNADQSTVLIEKAMDTAPWTQFGLWVNGADAETPLPGRKIAFNYIETGASIARNGYTVNDIIDGQWHHIAMVADQAANRVSIYVDGMEQEIVYDNYGTTWPNVMNGTDILIMNDIVLTDPALNHSEGRIDEVRLWNTARTRRQIRDDMYIPLDGAEMNLIGYWRFDENAGSYVTDASGNLNDALLYGAPAWQATGAPIRIVTKKDYTASSFLPGYDLNSDPVTFSIVTNGAAGTATIIDAATGETEYVRNIYSYDNFTYRITSGSGSHDYEVEVTPVFNEKGHLTDWTNAINWEADTVKIWGDVTVGQDTFLYINKDTYVEFQGDYKLNVNGQLWADGEPNDSIVFTGKTAATGWGGIRFFDVVPPTAYEDTSIIEHCILRYSRADGAGDEGKGGAIFVKNFDKLKVAYNQLYNNYAETHGGAVYCENAGIGIFSNFITNNQASTIDGLGGAIAMYLSKDTIINNVIANNEAQLGGGISFDQSVGVAVNNTVANNFSTSHGGGLYFTASAPDLQNNIVWGNNATGLGDQVCLQDDPSDPWLWYNNLQGGMAGFGQIAGTYDATRAENNINADPQFVAPTAVAGTGEYGHIADWTLQSSSPSINTGNPEITTEDIAEDIISNPRIYPGLYEVMDQGAYEYQGDPDYLPVAGFGNCLVFDGIDDWVEIPGDSPLVPSGAGDFTIAFWANPVGTGSIQAILQKNESAPGTLKISAWLDANLYLHFTLSDANGNFAEVTSNMKLPEDEWTHVTLVKRGSVQEIYFNGLPDNMGTIVTASVLSATASAGTVDLGTAGGGDYYTGQLDELSFWGIAALKYEIQERIYRNVAPNAPNLNGYWRFDENQGVVSYDFAEPLHANPASLHGTSRAVSTVPVRFTTKNSHPLSNQLFGYDLNGTGVAFAPVTMPTNGSLTLNADGTFDYLKTNYEHDVFSYEVSSNSEVSAPYDVNLTPVLNRKGDVSALFTTTYWGADTVKIWGDINIGFDTLVVIDEDTYIEFQDSYEISVDGRLHAIGYAADSIRFVPKTQAVGWKGIDFYYTSSTDSSIFDYCRFNHILDTDAMGGAFHVSGFSKLRISNSAFGACRAPTGGTSGIGAAIYLSDASDIKVYNTRFYKNMAEEGGAVYVDNSSPDFERNYFSFNQAIDGAAVHENGTSLFQNNIFYENTATNEGGAIFGGWNSNAQINGNLVLENAAYIGAGFCFHNSSTTLINNTIAENVASATDGGGGIAFYYDADQTLENNIIYANIDGNSAQNQIFIGLSGYIDPGFKFNCIQGGEAAFTGAGAAADYTGAFSNNITDDPLFADPPTDDFSLQPASPCINAGNPTTTLVNYDYDLDYSPRLQLCRIDMGAYEAATATMPGYEMYWTGCISTDWHEAGNWSTQTVPTLSDRVFVPGTAQAPNQPVLSANGACQTITIDADNNAKVTINSGFTLEIGL